VWNWSALGLPLMQKKKKKKKWPTPPPDEKISFFCGINQF
jgi:hypothetical protein